MSSFWLWDIFDRHFIDQTTDQLINKITGKLIDNEKQCLEICPVSCISCHWNKEGCVTTETLLMLNIKQGW